MSEIDTKPPRVDPFKPVQPKIPGVPEGQKTRESPAPVADSTVQAPLVAKTANPGMIWAAVGATLLILLAAALFWWRGRESSASSGIVVPDDPPPAAQATNPGQPAKPLGPGEIATTEELSKTWSSKSFNFREATGEVVPAMVVRLPGGSLWAFSLVEPFGSCQLEFVTDLSKLARDYNYQASHPMVANPCNRTVYDLTRYGPATNGLVRGEVAQGPGIRPPIAIEVQAKGGQVLATRME